MKKSGVFNTPGLGWEIVGTLMQLGKVAIASEQWVEAEKLLKRAVKLSLEVQTMPQAINAVLKLAECFIHRGEYNKTVELMIESQRGAV